jgi:CubicO group peptidase (beta-lactamase class C family)
MNAIRDRIRFVAVVVGAFLTVTHAKAGSAAGPSTRDLRRIADTDAGTMVTEGSVVGIIIGSQPPAMFTYGLADVDNSTPFSRDTDFEIGSVTKVFTTTLLGEAVTQGTLSLDQTLSQFSTELGTLQPLTGQVTLQELADFTGGFPSYAPTCAQSPTPGCLPSVDASLRDYNAKDFLAFFQNTVPTNYQNSPPQPAASLPVPYFYSDYSIGLLGLLLGATPNRPIDDSTLAGWWSLNQRALLAARAGLRVGGSRCNRRRRPDYRDHRYQRGRELCGGTRGHRKRRRWQRSFGHGHFGSIRSRGLDHRADRR